MIQKPLIIVNADDFGQKTKATDAITECYLARGITSATAMVWMQDSRRAGEVAETVNIPLGLHLNLTEPFTDPTTPRHAVARQQQLIPFFRGPTRWLFSPIVRRAVESSIQDQLDAFRSTYFREPTHLDGHHHVHFTPNVLLSRTIPPLMKLRRTYTYERGEKRTTNRAFRMILHSSLGRRHRTTEYFFDLHDLHPELGGGGMERKLDLAKSTSVEVGCHPEVADERNVLLSTRWIDTLTNFRTGSFLEL